MAYRALPGGEPMESDLLGWDERNKLAKSGPKPRRAKLKKGAA